jgi:hypothetical protein
MVKSRINSRSKSYNKNTSRKNGGQKSKKHNKSRKIKGGYFRPFVLEENKNVYDINYPINWTHLDNAHTYMYNSVYGTQVSNCYIRSKIQKMYTYFQLLETDDSDTTYHPSDTKREFVEKIHKFATKKIKSTLSTIFNYSLNFKLFEDAYNALVEQKLIKEKIIKIHLHTKIILVIVFVITFIIKYPLLILSDSIIPFGLKFIGTTTLINIAEGYCNITNNKICKIKDEIQNFLKENGLDNIFDPEKYNEDHVSIIHSFLRDLLKSNFVSVGNKAMFAYSDKDYLGIFKKYINLDKLSNYIKKIKGNVNITPEAFGQEGTIIPDNKIELSETCSSTN